MKNQEYVEGPEALKNFERLATAVMQAPNPKAKAVKSKTSAKSPKPKNTDKN